jgi:hypothetical protein
MRGEGPKRSQQEDVGIWNLIYLVKDIIGPTVFQNTVLPGKFGFKLQLLDFEPSSF